MLTGKEKAALIVAELKKKQPLILDLFSDQLQKIITDQIKDLKYKPIQERTCVLDEFIDVYYKTASKNRMDIKRHNKLEKSLDKVNLPSDLTSQECSKDNLVEEPIKDSTESIDFLSVSKILQQESPQTIAFLFSQLDNNKKEKIKNYLSLELIEKVQSISVEKNPFSKKLFDRLYTSIFEKKSSSV